MAPALLLSFLMAGIYGALFHLWRGRTFRELPFYLLVAAIGYGLGHLAGQAIGQDLFTIGPLHVIEATLGSWIFLFVARWLKV
jgi:hypothetical protein